MVAKPSEVTPLTHDRVRAPARRGGGARRGGEPGAGQRCGARSRADRHRRRRLHLVHRRRWPPGAAIVDGRRRARHQGGARTGRQEPAHRVRRRRMGQRRRPRAHRRVPALGTGLLGGHPVDRRGVDRRRLRRRPGRRGPEKIRIGDGMDPASETGPLVSEQHRAKVEAYVAAGYFRGREAGHRRRPAH